MNTKNALQPLADMPARLATAALVHGEEVAWEQGDCVAVIDWFRHASYAVLGIELWVLRKGQISTSISTMSGPVLYCTSCDPLKDECWAEYVLRSAGLATEAIVAFKWPKDSLETCPVYFNLCWADREWFQMRGKFQHIN